jgi:hypothetical protein
MGISVTISSERLTKLPRVNLAIAKPASTPIAEDIIE